MKSSLIMALATAIGILGAGPIKYAANSDALKSREFVITRTENLIVIDGDLDDKGWENASTTDYFLEFQPRDM